MDRIYGSSRARSTGSLNLGRRLSDLRLRLKTWRGILLIQSRLSVHTWTAAGTSLSSALSDRSRAPGCHGRWLERAQAQAAVHHLQWGFFLHDLCDERNPICPLTTVETSEGKQATSEQLGRPSTAVGTASDSAPALRTPPVAVV
jgi:hypothetical protein